MVGFGFMDNSIMILTGDLIDSTIGQRFQMATLTAAACGQLCSDTCGVCFGGAIEAMATKVGLPVPNLTIAQRQLRISKVVGTAGAAAGVILGCSLGMLNLLWLDLGAAEEERRLEELHKLFELVIETGRKKMGASHATMFMYDPATHELWTQVPWNAKKCARADIRIPASGGLAGAALQDGGVVNVLDAYEDSRFAGKESDARLGFRTREVLCTAVLAESKPVAVLQFVNKPGGFTSADEEVLRLLSEQVLVFMGQVDEKGLKTLLMGDEE